MVVRGGGAGFGPAAPPVQKSLPDPATTIARTAGAVIALLKNFVYSQASSLVQPLRIDGRLSVKTAMPSATAIFSPSGEVLLLAASMCSPQTSCLRAGNFTAAPDTLLKMVRP